MTVKSPNRDPRIQASVAGSRQQASPLPPCSASGDDGHRCLSSIPLCQRGEKDAAHREAKALLDAALHCCGIRVGASNDGRELLMVTPREVPHAVHFWFEHELALRRAEVIQVILRENGRGL
jgi:hypothetical protein